MQTVFLDRDGVINRNRPQGDYVKSWEEFQFLPGALGAIARLTQAGYSPDSGETLILRACRLDADWPLTLPMLRSSS